MDLTKEVPVKLEYIWIGGEDKINKKPFTIRSKTKVLYIRESSLPLLLTDIPTWNYDGSSTNQATTSNSEIVIIPCAMYNDPFRHGKNNLLVLCDTYLPFSESSGDKKGDCEYIPHPTNMRYKANEIFNPALDEKPWFGIEQEFFILSSNYHNKNKERNGGCLIKYSDYNPQGQYYCSCGTENAIRRNMVNEILDKAINAGLRISGMNAEVAPQQWEIQIGPCEGIQAGDQLWILRYIMERVSEKHGLRIELHPKPFANSDVNGSGCHVNYSTKTMREEGGYKIIIETIKKFSKLEKHLEHLAVYGEYNELRLTGKHETSSMDKFSYGVGSRNTSIRIPNEVFKTGKGYFEDRRPSSMMNPYLVTSKMFETTISKISNE